MAKRIRVCSKEFLLTWEEFEKAFYRINSCVEAIDIYHRKAGNC